jgi:hypothetical protein
MLIVGKLVIQILLFALSTYIYKYRKLKILRNGFYLKPEYQTGFTGVVGFLCLRRFTFKAEGLFILKIL